VKLEKCPPCRRGRESWNNGVMEGWSNGMTESWTFGKLTSMYLINPISPIYPMCPMHPINPIPPIPFHQIESKQENNTNYE